MLVGNYMNDSRKQASGFRLQSLARMSGVKDENNLSFLHHVEKVVRTAFPGLELFLDDLKPCREAAISTVFQYVSLIVVSVLDLERECNELIESVRIVQRSCDTGALSDPSLYHPEDRSFKLILSFSNEAQKKVKNLSALFEATINTEFEGAMRYFGEDPIDRSARSGFFRRFADFMTQYQSAKKENLEREGLKRKDQARKKVLGTAQTTPGMRDAKIVEANNKIMDDLLDKLRGAPKDSTRHQRRRAARRAASGTAKLAALRSTSGATMSVPSTSAAHDLPPVPTVGVVSTSADDGEVDLGKVAQGLLAGLKGGNDLLASFQEARNAVNMGMKDEGTTISEDPSRSSPDPVEPSLTSPMGSPSKKETTTSKEEDE